MPQPDHLRCSDADRTAIEQLLTDAYSDGRLTREEHDERLNRTWEAKTFGDLREITTDLVPTEPKSASYLVESTRDGRSRAVVDPAGAGSGSENIVAIFGDAKRGEGWRVRADTHVNTVFGDVKLDLTKAVFDSASSQLNVMVAMGDVVLRVPAGVRIRNETASIFGDVKVVGLEPDESGPELVLTGFCIFGDVKVYGPKHKSFFKKFKELL